MKLKDYLKKQKISASELARRIGVSVSAVARWVPKEGKRQVRRPDWDALEKLAVTTEGEVMPNDFLPDEILRSVEEKR